MPTDPIPTTSTEQTAQRNLLLFTSVSSLDGTVMLLAAGGALSSTAGAAVAGLTVVAGAGAWLSARDAFRSGLGGGAWRRLLSVALPAMVLTLIATLVGTQVGGVALTVLPKVAGVALLFVAAEVTWGRAVRIGRVPVALALLLVGIPLEVLGAWTP